MVGSAPANSAFRATMYGRSAFGSNGSTSTSTSPPAPSFRSDIFGQSSMAGTSHLYSNPSPTAERHPTMNNGAMPALSASTSDPLTFGPDSWMSPAVMIRKLPLNMGISTLRSMFLFSNDLLDTDFVHLHHPEDRGFAAAIARFRTSAGALEAIQKLNGKPNTSQEANMVVEPYGGGVLSAFERRNTIDGTASRAQTSSTSSAGSAGVPGGRSRFNSAFQPPEKVSPPLPTPNSNGSSEYPGSGNTQHFHKLFSPQSPLSNGVDGPHRVSGKSMINDDSVDDETGELLKDPVAYAKNGQQSMARRATNPHIPVARFASLSVSTGNGPNNGMVNGGYTSPRRNPGPQQQQVTSPVAQSHTPTANPNSSHLSAFSRPQYPPVNPADQNPPCNTLYVGNLPIDTNEDELKALFSKVRGYKRLCFRTKHNGPMCFVEFEDVSFATKALHELYGHLLHNSVKGGIRLSFSKNPLGVRSGQTSGLGPNVAMTPQAMAPGYTGITSNGNFSSVSGPPPGLGTPAGLLNGNIYRPQPQTVPVPTGMDAMFPTAFQMQHPGPHINQVQSRNFSGGVPPIMGNGTYGRDTRDGSSRTDYTEPRAAYDDARTSYNDLLNGYGDGQNGYSDFRNAYTSYSQA